MYLYTLFTKVKIRSNFNRLYSLIEINLKNYKYYYTKK